MMKSMLLSLLFITLSIFFKKPVFIGLLFSILFIYIEHISKGYSYKNLNKSLLEGISSAKKVLIILSLIGILTSLWMVCGTIPYLMYLGLKLLKNYNFIFISFLIMSIISYTLGTAVGSISSIGIVLMSIGKSIGVSPSILGGAIVSGAFLGDRSSPLSSAFHLTTEMTNTTLLKNMKKMNMTLLPAFILSGLIYYILGKSYSHFNTENIDLSLKILLKNFNLSFFSCIPLIILFLCIVLRINIIIAIIASIFSSFIIGIFLQNIHLLPLLKISMVGFKGNAEISSLLSGGGLFSMKSVLITIISATAFTGLLEYLNLLNPIIYKLTKHIHNGYDLLLKCGILSIALNTITCNQTIGIIIPAKFMKDNFDKIKLNNEYLAHCISDTGNITVPLIPWNVNSIVASTLLGISSIQFIPYAFLCYFIPIIFAIKYKLRPPI